MAVLKGYIKAKGLTKTSIYNISKGINKILSNSNGLDRVCFTVGVNYTADSDGDVSMELIFSIDDLNYVKPVVSALEKNRGKISSLVYEATMKYYSVDFVDEVETLDSFRDLAKNYKGLYDPSLVEDPDNTSALVVLVALNTQGA